MTEQLGFDVGAGVVASGRVGHAPEAAWQTRARAAQARRCAELLADGHATAPAPAGCSALCAVCLPARAHLPLERSWPRCAACHQHHPGVTR